MASPGLIEPVRVLRRNPGMTKQGTIHAQLKIAITPRLFKTSKLFGTSRCVGDAGYAVTSELRRRGFDCAALFIPIEGGGIAP